MTIPYQLIDFGNEEKLESFAGTIVRRATPSGVGDRRDNPDWESCDLRGRRVDDQFQWQGQAPDDWNLELAGIQFELRTTPTGQVGVFPEQETNWRWISEVPLNLAGAKALNLFAYTGGTSFALAKREVEVTHVDSAKSVVNWARQNATLSGLKTAPIRWIVEDALTFVRREIKRGNRYDIVVADPPSFGRGPKGEWWKVQRDLDDLLDGLDTLLTEKPKMILLSCHTPGINHQALGRRARNFMPRSLPGAEDFELTLVTSDRVKSLPSGCCFRWVASE